ncbi:TRAP transporter large permease [Consotaella salsifontis]|uniref:TRAP transporter large permease protein n=1 Tax=Consotaella salsifontis TaxID=1365950 RepID=A0A1T4T308_9HYPH|nr:TRAP transporter large permease [Consotaella salsifontis]SKA34651.1 TRAP transporter, DctM subunit [Consotaella salsifontis]
MTFLYIWFFAGFLIIGMPMVYMMLLAPGIALYLEGKEVFLNLLFQRLFAGIDSFPLMALPFFILAGEMMTAGGVTQRMVNFANALIGHLRGGLAHVTVCSAVMLAGGCGSAVADASALGSIMIPAMRKSGYSARFSSAVVAASAVIVSIIPPSGIFILYAFIMNVSVAAMFAGGVIAGLLIAIALMIVIAIRAHFEKMPRADKRASMAVVLKTGREAFLPLMTPVILIGGIIGGVFTPTEAAAIAAVYSMILGLFYTKEIKFSGLPGIFARTALSSAVILMLVGAAVSFASVVSLKGTPQLVSSFVLSITSDPYLLFFLINVLLLIVGMLMDAGPAILILAPILAPVMTHLGIDPVHFAVVMSINMIIGLITPPMGLVLFVISGISRERVEAISLQLLPFLFAELCVLALITYVPDLVLMLPRALGYVQ